MRFRSKVRKKNSKKIFRRSVRPLKMNRRRQTGLKRGGTRL